MPLIANARARELIAKADKEFNEDGGLSYTQSVLRSMQESDIRFNPNEACMVLVTLHRSLLQEYGRLVAQVEAAGTEVIAIGPLARG